MVWSLIFKEDSWEARPKRGGKNHDVADLQRIDFYIPQARLKEKSTKNSGVAVAFLGKFFPIRARGGEGTTSRQR